MRTGRNETMEDGFQDNYDDVMVALLIVLVSVLLSVVVFASLMICFLSSSPRGYFFEMPMRTL